GDARRAAVRVRPIAQRVRPLDAERLQETPTGEHGGRARRADLVGLEDGRGVDGAVPSARWAGSERERQREREENEGGRAHGWQRCRGRGWRVKAERRRGGDEDAGGDGFGD